MKSTPKPKIIVLAQTKAWSSLIRRTFEHADLCWVLDADDLEADSKRLNARVAIVEFPTTSADRLAVRLSSLTNNSTNLKIFAVGDSDLYRWRELLQVAGIAMSCWSTLQADSLAEAIQRHLQTSPATDYQTVESFVESDLPWPTAANGSTA